MALLSVGLTKLHRVFKSEGFTSIVLLPLLLANHDERHVQRQCRPTQFCDGPVGGCFSHNANRNVEVRGIVGV